MIDALNAVSSISGLGAVGKTVLESRQTEGTSPAMATGQSFGDVLTQMASDAMTNIKQGEAMSFAGLQGKASTREVVDAVMQAEQALQTAISLRDKVVSAFLDVTRMQI